MTAPAPDAHPAATDVPPEQAAYETWQETRWPGRVPVPWNHPATAASREAWRAAVQAATGQVLRQVAAVRAERDEARALAAEVITAYDAATECDRTPEDEARLAGWQRRAERL